MSWLWSKKQFIDNWSDIWKLMAGVIIKTSAIFKWKRPLKYSRTFSLITIVSVIIAVIIIVTVIITIIIAIIVSISAAVIVDASIIVGIVITAVIIILCSCFYGGDISCWIWFTGRYDIADIETRTWCNGYGEILVCGSLGSSSSRFWNNYIFQRGRCNSSCRNRRCLTFASNWTSIPPSWT